MLVSLELRKKPGTWDSLYLLQPKCGRTHAQILICGLPKPLRDNVIKDCPEVTYLLLCLLKLGNRMSHPAGELACTAAKWAAAMSVTNPRFTSPMSPKLHGCSKTYAGVNTCSRVQGACGLNHALIESGA